MIKFSEWLNEKFNSKEELKSAINKFDSLPPAKQASEAKTILKDAERIGYVVRSEKVLKYADNNKIKQQNDTKPDDPQINDKSSNIKDNKKENIFVTKYKHLQLSKYPPADTDETKVVVNLSDMDTSWVLKWVDKNGKTQQSYTPTFLEKSADEKWDRVSSISKEEIKAIDDKTLELLNSQNEDDKQIGTIIRMLWKTGLRVGDIKDKNQTGNRGISSLSPNNIEIFGDFVKLDFVGKNYKQNTSEFEDKDVAKYLETLKEKKQGNKYIFDQDYKIIEREYHKIVPDMKIKDLRTLKANETANEFLNSDIMPPLPLPEKPSEIKKSIESKLKKCFDITSDLLNNTPKMAEQSYIIPKTIDKWVDDIGCKIVYIGDNKKKKDYVLKEEDNTDNQDIENDFESPEIENEYDNVDYYNLPVWFNNPDYIIINKKKYNTKE